MKISKDSVTAILAEHDGGFTMSRLAAALGVGKGQRNKLRTLIEELVADGAVAKDGRKFILAEKPKPKRKRRNAGEETATRGPQAVGLIRVHPAGYGFVEREDELGDVFVPAKYRGTAMDGDRVLLYTWQGYKGTEGRVEEVLERGRAKLTGTVRRSPKGHYVEPDDPRIATDHGSIGLEGGAGGAREGQCVLVEITQYPDVARSRLMGRVVKVLGDPEDPRTEIEKIIAVADIPAEFPDAVVAQAKRTPQEVTEADLADRIDLRDRDFITIDPETARDFDDALCIEEGPHGGPRVWVAVADVSHYVRPGDALDREALVRGVSVYLPDRVIPMLPFELSSGICSLNPDVDRCAMVIRLDFDKAGRVFDTGFAAAVIRSKARLDYPGAAAALAGDFRGPRSRYRQWAPNLEKLSALAQTMRDRRRARGTLELEIPEAKVLLDADDPRLVRDVVRAKGVAAVKAAYELVEEFMIAANEAVGSFFASRDKPTLWRTHAPPGEERLVELAEILQHFDIYASPSQMMSPLGIREVLQELEGKPEQAALSFLVLRALSQAVYDTVNLGHFGLASGEYLHFTSPIRRYPDLVVHRLLKLHLQREGQAAGGGASAIDMPAEKLQEVARETSTHERRAIGAEREAVAMYRALFMREHVGETFEGQISGVTSFGVFVQLDEPFIEGLVKIENLGEDYYEFDPLAVSLTGRRTRHTLKLADRVEVDVLSASIVKRAVELRLAGSPAAAEGDDSGYSRRPKPRPRRQNKAPKRRSTSHREPKRGKKRRRRR